MQYFTKELWLQINSHNEEMRLQAEKDWNLRSMEYLQQFELAKKYLPQKFVKDFMDRNGLHDYSIVGIVLSHQLRASSCEIKLSNREETILLKMTEIKSFQIGIDSLDYCINGNLLWGYSEFEITPRNTIRLSVICDIDKEIAIEFEKISLKSSKQKWRCSF